MKKALCTALALCCAGIMLTGCGSKDVYIECDEDYNILDAELAGKLEMISTPLNTVVTDYKYDTQMGHGGGRGFSNFCTISDKYIYIFWELGYEGDEFHSQRTQNYRIDLRSGAITPRCAVPGCEHDITHNQDCSTIANYEFGDTAVGDTMLSIAADENGHRNCISEVSGNEEKVIFKNTYYTDFEVEYCRYAQVDDNDDQYMFALADFLVDDDHIYAFGPSYAFRIDRKTMKPEDMIVINDYNAVLNVYRDGDNIYALTDLDELYKVDFDKREATKIADKCTISQIYDGKMYYTREEGDVIDVYDYFSRFDDVWDYDEQLRMEKEYIDSLDYMLYCREIGSDEETLVLKDCCNFVISHGKVFYRGGRTDDFNILKSYDLETKEDKVIYDDWAFARVIFTSEHIDRIFAIGTEYAEGYEDTVPIPVFANTFEHSYDKVISFRIDGSDLWEVTFDDSSIFV